MNHFRECFDRQVSATDELLRNFLNGPAPKEKEMQFENCCRKCDRGFMANVNNARFCPECAKARAAERRALARDAYMAALGGLSSIDGLADDGIVQHATAIALETVRRWDSFLAAVDAEGGE